ncbi:MAG: membrane protein insertion efficiency factor YidD, partial [Synergistaceae bacterium]
MKPASLVGLFFIRFYQAALSPMLGGGKCSFYPTCS